MSYYCSLKNAKDISAVFKRGKIIRSQNFQINALNNQEALLGLVVIVPKKVLKLAVDRNRIARRIKAIIREYQINNSPISGFNIAVLPRKEALNTKYADLKKELSSLLNQIV